MRLRILNNGNFILLDGILYKTKKNTSDKLSCEICECRYNNEYRHCLVYSLNGGNCPKPQFNYNLYYKKCKEGV